MKSPYTDSLSHTTFECKYHIVFAPKYRKKGIYNKLRKDIGEYIRRLCDYKGAEIVERNACRPHSYANGRPLKMSISSFKGYQR